MYMLQDAADNRIQQRIRRKVALVAASALLGASGALAQQLLPPAFTSTPVTAAGEGTAYSYSITVADLDLLDTITITSPALPAWLTLTDHGDRTATLAGTPTAAEVGPHAVLLEASDGVNIAQQSFTITVAPDTTPVAAADTYSTAEDTALTVAAAGGVLANDTNAVSAALVTAVSSGTLTLNADGGFTYTPAANFTGAATFDYQASNGSVASNTVTVTIDVTAGADAPVAVNDSYTTAEDTQLTVPVPTGVLANDTDADGEPLTAALVANVANGTLALNANGSFIYMPNANFTGQDTFTYRASDGTTPSADATVTITVSAGNDTPVAVNDSYSVPEDAPLTVAAATGVLVNDTDADGGPLTAVLVRNVVSGTLALAVDGSFTYTPNPGFNGTDSFTYQASDGTVASNTATVSIGITAGNDAPVAVADTYTTAEDTVLTVPAATGVLANDTDPDNDPLSPVLITNVASGALTLNTNGSFTYTPAPGFNGAATFTYQAADGPLTSNTVTVTINVTAVNDAPVAVANSYTTAEDTPLAVTAALGLLANDTDSDTPAASLTAVLGTAVTSGTLTLASNGSFNYTPASNFSGTATFTYQARDGALSSAAVTVTITVTAVNDAPFISSAPATTVAEGVTYSYTLTAADADGNLLAIAAPTLPPWLVFVPPATITGTPAQANVGVHAVAMTVTDAVAAPVAQNFQITVQAVDNAPIVAAIPDQVATEAAALTVNLAQFVTDADTPPASIVYAAAAALPPGLALSAAGVLSGMPQRDLAVGQHVVRFTAADATSSAAGQFNLTVLRAGRADLAVAVSAAPNPVALSATATWTVTITNQAPQVEVGGVSLDAVFAGEVPFRFDTPATPGCTATTAGNETRVLCTLGALAGGASTSLTLTGSSTFAGDVFATATVAVNGSVPIDETPGNDRATASLSIAQNVSSNPAQSIPGLSARAAAAGDFDGDGFDDLAVATGSSQGAIVLMNVADPANAAKRLLSSTPRVLGGEALGVDVAAADLDKDGDVDIVTAASAGAPNRVFLNTAGSFAAAALANAPAGSRAVAVGDINGDTFLDLVFASPGASLVYVNRGSGGAFTAGTSVAAGDARDVVLVDLFGDPLPELIVAKADGGAAVYRNAGGAFQLELTLPSGAATSVSAADFNNDSRVDLVLGRNIAAPPATRPSNLVFLNTSGARGEFFVADELGAAATVSVSAEDLDLDDDVDVLAVNQNVAQLHTNVGTASGTFALHPQQLGSAGALMAATGRFSVDQRVDVALVANGGIAVFYNDGHGNLGSGDAVGPTIQLRGTPSVTLNVGETYADAGATASDTIDGDVSSRVTVTNPVDSAVIGTYTVTYAATDLSGNAAAPVTRAVQVQARQAEGGGGGALVLELALLWLAAGLRRISRQRR